MRGILNLPTRSQASEIIAEAAGRNPGPWVRHSEHVAQAAQLIAARVPSLDPEAAYILGYLHDIGRRAGVTDMRHTLDGYLYLSQLGYEDAARICLTHSFSVQDISAGAGKWDCSPEEYHFVEQYLATIEYNEYDRLIQLCDSLALPDGFCLIEKRLVDVALRYGVNQLTIEKWKRYFQIKAHFEEMIGQSIYSLLPGVIENTFGFDHNTPTG